MASSFTAVCALVFLVLPFCYSDQEVPLTFSDIQESLGSLKIHWNEIFESQLLNTEHNISCGPSEEYDSPRCWELNTVGKERIFLATAGSRNPQMGILSDETRICTTLQTFLQGALNWTSPLVSPHIHLLTFTDAQGRYKGTLIPPDLSDGTEDPCAGRGSEGTQNGLLCNKLKPADVLDTRRDKTYIHTASSSPKLVTILDLVNPTAASKHHALKTTQYILNYTLARDEDYFTLFNTPASPQGNTTPASPQGDPTTQNSTSYRSERVFLASEYNITQTILSLDPEGNPEGHGTSNTANGSASTLDLNSLAPLLSPRHTLDTRLPCLRVLIVIIDRDIDVGFAEFLIAASDKNPGLLVVLFAVGPLAGCEGVVFENVASVLRRAKAVLDVSDVDVECVSNRASNVQSYLNYLSFTGATADPVVTTVRNTGRTSSLDACVHVFSDVTVMRDDDGNGEDEEAERVGAIDVLVGTLCLKFEASAFEVNITSSNSSSSNWTCAGRPRGDLHQFQVLRESYQNVSPSSSSCITAQIAGLGSTYNSTHNSTSSHTPVTTSHTYVTTSHTPSYSLSYTPDSSHALSPSHITLSPSPSFSPMPTHSSMVIPSSTQNSTPGSAPSIASSSTHILPGPTPSPTPDPASSASDLISRIEEGLRLVRDEIKDAFRNSSYSQTCPYGDIIQDSCWNNSSPGSRQDDQRGCLVDRNTSSLYARGRLADQEYIKRFNCSINEISSNNPEISERLCATQVLSSFGSSQLRPRHEITALFQEPAVLWLHYSDAKAGFLRVYPHSTCGHRNGTAAAAGDRGLCGMEDFDPRLRPWYISTITPQKILYLIIHTTREENFEAMKRAGQRFLDTTIPGDMVGVYVNTMESRSIQHATYTNVQDLRSFILSQEYSKLSGPAVREGFATAFREINRTNRELDRMNRGLGTSQPCNRIIILLSDSSLTPQLTNQIQQLQSTPRADIFTYSFGGLTVDPTVPQDIACSARGAWFGTGSQTQPHIDEVVTQYLEFYPSCVGSCEGGVTCGGGVVTCGRGRVTWTGVTEDVLSQRSVITGCYPLYQDTSADDASYGSADDAPYESADDAPYLLGVVCIDVDVAMVPGLTEIFPDLLTSARVCPPSNNNSRTSPTLSEDQRESLRSTKCGSDSAPNITSELVNLLTSTLEQAAEIQTQAYIEFSLAGLNNSACPYASAAATTGQGLGLFSSCFPPGSGGNAVSFSADSAFSDSVNVSFDIMGVITREDTIRNREFNDSLCLSLIQQRPWRRLWRVHSLTTLQLFSPDDQPYTLTYPALQLDMPTCHTYSETRPQFQPHYVSTASAGKAVVFILDLSHHMSSTNFTSSPYPDLILKLLPSLAVVDHFSIIAGSATFNSTLVPGTGANFKRVNDSFLSGMDFEPSDQQQMMERAFAILNDSSIATPTWCQLAIVIITNRRLDKEIPALVNRLNAELSIDSPPHVNTELGTNSPPHKGPVKIFVNTDSTDIKGTGTTEHMLTERMFTCNNSGIWSNITQLRPSEMYERVVSYYRVLAWSTRVQQPVWSEVSSVRGFPQMGVVNNGTGLCLPIYNDSSVALLGVTCIVLPGTEVRKRSEIQQEGALSMGEEFLERVVREQNLPLSCTTLSPSVEDLDKLRPPEGRCQPEALPTTSTSPSVAPSRSAVPPPATPTTRSATTVSGGTRGPKKSFKPSYIAAIAVSSTVLLLFLMCLCIMLLNCYSSNRSPRNRGYSGKAGQDFEEFATDYKKLHENIAKEENDQL